MVTSVVRDRLVADPTFYGGKEGTLVRNYFRYRDKPARMIPAHLISAVDRMQRWGKFEKPPIGPEQARAFVEELDDAIGPDRKKYFGISVGQIFDMAGRKFGVTDHDKIEWLRMVLHNLKTKPAYVPQERPEIRNRTKRDKLLALILAAPNKLATIPYLVE